MTGAINQAPTAFVSIGLELVLVLIILVLDAKFPVVAFLFAVAGTIVENLQTSYSHVAMLRQEQRRLFGCVVHVCLT